ncbi:MAG: amino acid adenylation domain-containing protein, partial [Butyrivibrio sp.]|nr:amino acid adenylation domain-containing protein [Butyrivibrio sp.]
YVIKVEDISDLDNDMQQEALLKERDRMSHEVFNPEEWPLFEVKALKHGNRYYLLIGLDMLIMDANGMSMFAKDLFYYYQNPEAPVEKIDFTFRDYVINYLELRKSQEWENDREYWLGKISEFNGAPTLPLKKDVASVRGTKYSRIETSISTVIWSELKKVCLGHNITPSVLLCTIYYEILSLWSNKTDFAINITTVNKRHFNVNVDKLLGDFTSSMILCLSNVDNNNFWDKAQRIQKCICEGLEHSLFDGVDFVRELSEKEGLNGKAVLPVVFTSVIPDDIWGNWEVFGDINYSISQTSQVYLDYQASEKDGALHINWDYVEELLDKNMISDMFEIYLNRLNSVLECGNESISIPEYQSSLYKKYNDTKTDISLNTLDGLFLENVEKYPDNIAIVDGDTKVTYKELDRISNQIANKLIELGVMPKDMVCVSARRCYWSIANVLGILKANAAYVPVDEDYPKERIDYIINQSGSKLYLKPEFYVENKLEDYDDSKPACNHDLNDTAYVIFTSGSTGKPKGVVIAHGAASNTILDINNKFNVSDKDNIIGISSMCFDLSVYDIFGSLSTGASLVQIKDPKDVENVVDILQKEQITLWNSVPAILDMIVDNANEQISNSSMRHILLSGDWIPLGLPDKARRAFVNSDVTSLGGATEASIWSIYYPIKNVDEKWKSIPYGMPLANQTYYVLNEDGHDCPIGVEGELYIGGIGVAEGYCGDEEKTREAFILHPVYGRIYKTGDYGKFVFDNENNLIIEFMGRRDFQVKIGGFRIELTEIEKNLLKIDGITKCVVIDKDLEAGKKILCAFYVSDNEYEQADIKEKLGEFLTPYMIPDVIAHIEEIPTTRNGKVDRKELLNLVQFEQKHDEEFMAPSNKVEATLMEIFAENLGVEKISVSANLNDYSINSIKSVSIIAQIGKRIGVKLKYKDFTSKKSIKELAAYIYSLNKDNAIQIQQIKEYTMDREHSYEKFPVTEIQYAYIMGRNPLFDIGGVSAHTYAELDGNIDIDRLENGIRKTVKRHPMLRTLFTDDGMQYVLENVPDYEISIIDISDKGAEYKENYLKQIRNEYSHHMFKIDKWPLFDFTAVKLDENKYRLLIGYDLLISDGASASLIGNDIAGYYYDDDYDPEELNFTFRDYVLAYEKIREDEDYLSAKEYWLNRLDTCPVAPTLVMKTDPSKVDNPFFDRVCTRIDNTTWNRISDAAKAHNVTPTALLCTAYAKVLSVWSNQSVVPINMTVFNRYPVHSQINELVGDFTSTMIINADMRSQDNSIWQIASRINNEIMDDIDNRYFDGVEFIRELSKKNNYGVKAVMPYVFTSMLNDGGQKDADSNFSLGMFDYMTSQTPQVFIDCQIIEAKEGILISWDYVTQLFDSEMINTMFNQFIKLFSEANDSEKMEALGLMASEKKILEDYNKTEHSITPELLHSMFEQSVSQHPDNVAVIDGDGQYTYRELNARANQIAYSLRASGIKKGQMILVYAARCRQTIANIMGILKAGGAYVPIDPQYPEDRIQYIMKNSNTDIILYPDYYDQNDVSRFEIENLPYVNELEDTAYVIYTSGSTGRPKGVVISHKAVSNTIKDINERFNVTSEDRMLGISSMCFDLSVYDIFGSLSTGAALVQVKDQRDIFDIKSLIDKYQITIWNSVPAIMDMLVQHINSVYSNSVEIQDKADDICEVDGLMIDRQVVEEKELQYYWSVLYSWKIENDTLIIGENRYTDKEIINLFPEFYYVLSDGCSINDIMTRFSEVQNRKLISFINEVIEKEIIKNSIHDPLDLFK